MPAITRICLPIAQNSQEAFLAQVAGISIAGRVHSCSLFDRPLRAVTKSGILESATVKLVYVVSNKEANDG